MEFLYGEREITYLKGRDQTLGQIIDAIGPIHRTVQPDLFCAVVHSILGQQISTKAHNTLWNRMQTELGAISADTVLAAGRDRLQQLGTTYRKVDYLLDFAQNVQQGDVDLHALAQLPDDAFIAALSQQKGVGVWTAEMILLFCLQRPNVFSYGDLAILRGLRMVYHHRAISRPLFETYRRRFSPCCSVASLYLWAVAGGAIPGMRDYAPQKPSNKRTPPRTPRRAEAQQPTGEGEP